jgi:galactose mutarotase-like enzyme
MNGCRLSDEYARKGVDAIFLENESLRVEVLAGKGGDVTEIRDKRTDVNVLFESPHEWHPPDAGAVGAPDGEFAFMDHYPGGWQDVLPAAGGPSSAHGAPLALHGESALVPWDYAVTDRGPDRVAVALDVSLSRYPFDVTREIALERGGSALSVRETVRNRGEVDAKYSWLQHVALGRPLVAPGARLSVPCETVLVDPDQTTEAARLPAGESFEWPVYRGGDGDVDLREFPPKDARVHDLVALTDLSEGRYTVENPDLDLGVTVRFPADVFEYLWYWQPFGGFAEAPFFGRNYNVGLEPCTSIPNAGLERAIENGTAERLAPGAEVTAEFEFAVHPVAE